MVRRKDRKARTDPFQMGLPSRNEKPSEMTYASDLKEAINQILVEEKLPLSHSKVEVIKAGRRPDITLYDKARNPVLIISVKRPKDTPASPEIKKDAFSYVENYPKLRYVATHNVNHLILWDAITGGLAGQFRITHVRRLEHYEGKIDEIKESFRGFLKWFARFLEGESPKPIDESIAGILSSSIEGIVASTDFVPHIMGQYQESDEFRKEFQIWLLDKGWPEPKNNRELERYSEILVKQFLYMFVNKLLFYNVLRDRISLPKLSFPDNLKSEAFHSILHPFFDVAIKSTGDYETVFQTNFVDSVPVPDDAIVDLSQVSKYLEALDYAGLGYDIIGKVFEKLIPEDERHIHGQYFTPSDVVDLILGFCIKAGGNPMVLDPSCGSGTFLVRSYYRLKHLNPTLTHEDILGMLWGIDIAKFPAHLSTINLAIQDLGVGNNYPNIIYRDFFDIVGPKTDVRIGVQSSLTQYGVDETRPKADVEGLDKTVMDREIPNIQVLIGNPPYTRQEELEKGLFGEGYKEKLSKVLSEDFPGVSIPQQSGIYTYFAIHGMKFTEEGGRLGFVTLRMWLDVGYGEKFKEFLLNHCKVVTIIEALSEKWFADAQMLPCILVVEASNSKRSRDTNVVKFVQLKAPLNEFIPPITDQRDKTQEVHRWNRIDEFVRLVEDAENTYTFEILEHEGRNIRLYEDDKLRISLISQKDLRPEEKWGKFLTAPSVYFRMYERAQEILVPLHPNLATVRRGITTGANEFFCLPSKHFSLREEKKGMCLLIDKATGEPRYEVETDFLVPAITKIRPHKAIAIEQTDMHLLMVRDSKKNLSKKNRSVLRYIEQFGEKKKWPTRKRGESRSFAERETCAQREKTKKKAQHKGWYDLGRDRPSLILSPSIFWGRYLMFLNTAKALATDCLDEIEPKVSDHAKTLCALLNSTFNMLQMEFLGRYIENRDSTISNEVKVYELKKLKVIDPAKLDADTVRRLENALDKIIDRPILTYPDEIGLSDRRELDRIVFCDILGFDEKDMKEAQEALALLVRRRIERLSDEQQPTVRR